MGILRPDRIPLFPLNVVLLPGAALPLHIFEPRYKGMVKDCLDEKSEFGVLLALPKGEATIGMPAAASLAKVGCTAEILEIVKRYPDGRMDIVTVGRSPFRVVELFSENPLLKGQVDYLEDRGSLGSPVVQRQLIELYEACHTLLFEDYPKNIEGAPVEELSYRIASTLSMDLLWKQQILELRSEEDRQERLVGYLREWAPHLQNNKVMRQRAGGNGHGLN